ncbi:MerR family regulatory protein [Clavibacter michiganensis subsp. michiganensis]|uniref:MerR family regulatory protein n=1 Tax=Clavibacter michiganensis subsp. michiganensis TaxID=33013 RepID=A0A251XDW0_CLAMM|nr:MerR family regulatory protein [Clavibacter michiganensis subsp. michiganensis]OUE00028.1 MerR family regulatory protein [Clavibacter michiganensis subsp. michiganensis]
MRITELAETTGVPPATVKYYVREGLLPAGTRVRDNRTDYDDEHARRIRLIRALIDVGRLPVARAREVLAVLDDDDRRVQDVFASRRTPSRPARRRRSRPRPTRSPGSTRSPRRPAGASWTGTPAVRRQRGRSTPSPAPGTRSRTPTSRAMPRPRACRPRPTSPG